jgi:hypothetical protein
MSTSCRRFPASAQTFGRRLQSPVPSAARSAPVLFSEDARLFAMTFAGGFLFMLVYLA